MTAWWDQGVPKQSVRHWARLNALARLHGFDAGMLVDDRLWTAERARQAVEQSGQTQAAWAAAAGCHRSTIRDAIQGRRRLNRPMAYYLTWAAVRFGMPLPPPGYLEPKRRKARPFPGGFKGIQGGRVWTPEELGLLGTVPDAVLAGQLGNRTEVAVRRMRRLLEIPSCPKRGWDGQPIPGPVSKEEVCRRYRERFSEPRPAGRGLCQRRPNVSEMGD